MGISDRFLIVGLGNPGREYEKTRHNIGFRMVDALAAAHHLTFDKKQARALIGDGTIADRRVLLVKPQTYMNLSGEAVGSLMYFYKVPLANLLTLSDDMDLPLGTLRIRAGGSAGGQNGLKNIIAHVRSQDFPRIQFGLGRPPGHMNPAAYVLQDFEKSEQALMAETMDRALRAVDTYLRYGIELAMTRHNGTNEHAARTVNDALPVKASAPLTDDGVGEQARAAPTTVNSESGLAAKASANETDPTPDSKPTA